MLSGLSSKSLSSSGTAKAISNIQKKSSSEITSSDQTQNSDAKENTNNSSVKDKVAASKITKFKDGIISERIQDIGNMALKDQVEAKFPTPDTSKSSSSSAPSSPGAGSQANQSSTAPASSTPNFGQAGGQGGSNGGGNFGGGGSGSHNPWLGQPNVQTPRPHPISEGQSLTRFAQSLVERGDVAAFKLTNHNGHSDLVFSGVKPGAEHRIEAFAQQSGQTIIKNGNELALNSSRHQQENHETHENEIAKEKQEAPKQENLIQERNNQEQVA